MGIKPGWKLLKEAFKSWADDYAPSMGAALSYYTMFSIAPLLLIVITVAGLFFGPEAVRGAVFGQLTGLMGDDGARAVQDMLAHVSEPKQGVLASLAGVGALLLGASTVFGELQNGMDRIWRAPVQNKPTGIWGMIQTRLLSFGMILGLAFLLAVSLLASAAVAALGKWWGPYFGAWEVLAHALDLAVSFGLLTLIFGAIYKIMPRVPVHWHDVWVGAAFTALLFTIGKFVIGLYLGKSDIASGFGAAGSLVVVMVWVYYSAQIFYLGAEFTRVYAHAFGSRRGQAEGEAAKEMQGRTGRGMSTAAGVPGAEAANSPLDAPPAAAVSPGQRAIAARRAATARAVSRAPRDEITISHGRLMVDPVGKGLDSRQLAKEKRRARSYETMKASAPVVLTVAAAAGLLVGLARHVKSMRRPTLPWLHA
jgi:membrane protein